VTAGNARAVARVCCGLDGARCARRWTGAMNCSRSRSVSCFGGCRSSPTPFARSLRARRRRRRRRSGGDPRSAGRRPCATAPSSIAASTRAPALGA
jgi:hypothetical protein